MRSGSWQRSSTNKHVAEFTRPATWEDLRAVAALLNGVPLPVLGLAGLLLTKEGMRDKDRADRRVIEQALAALEEQS